MNQPVYIFSQPIHSGKTSALMRWLTTQNNVAGILTPDVEGKRKLFDIATGKFEIFEDDTNQEDCIETGKYTFRKSAFERARMMLSDAAEKSYNWLIIDEIGKLELVQKTGFEPVLSEIIQKYKEGKIQAKLLLVIRDYLLEDAIDTYNLKNFKVINSDFFRLENNQNPEVVWGSSHSLNINIAGLILCGGKSTRMGTDKALLNYHGEPQFLYLYNQLSEFYNQVFISCSKNQEYIKKSGLSFIEDHANDYGNAGPMTALLSAFKEYPEQAFFVLGCDYPFFNATAIQKLNEGRSSAYDVVCYGNPESGFNEPLLAIYEPACAAKLSEFYTSGNTSLLKFLTRIRLKVIMPDNIRTILSVDSKKDYLKFTLPGTAF